MSTPPAHPRIPYGEADFRRIRLNRWLYVDKTRFLRLPEDERYAFLIRPRRFGKSLWASVLENYYDRFRADGFDATFAGTDIGQSPTGEQSRYVTLRFDFSTVNDALETLEREFETYCLIELRGTLERHPDLFPEATRRRILAPPSIATKLAELFRYAGDHDIPLYVMGIMGEWYNGYRFAKAAATDLYNTDMVLYYLKHSIPNRDFPDELIDTNVRIDYGKLRHLLVVGRQLNGNFDLRPLSASAARLSDRAQVPEAL